MCQAVSVCAGQSRRSSVTPKFSANVQSEFGFDVIGRADGFLRGLYTLAGKNSNDPDNSLDHVGAYGLLNLFVGLRDEDGAWEVSLFGKNITREREVLSVGATPQTTTIRTPGVTNFLSQYRSITITQPREFGVQARIAFGSR